MQPEGRVSHRLYRGGAPGDVWLTPSNLKDKVVFASPKDFGQRTRAAASCVRKLGIKFPALVDRFDNPTERDYTAWPDRIYLVNKQRRIVYKSRPGPFGFKPQELQSALQAMLGK